MLAFQDAGAFGLSLLTLVRAEAAGKGKRFSIPRSPYNNPVVIDRFTAELKLRTSQGRAYSTASGMN